MSRFSPSTIRVLETNLSCHVQQPASYPELSHWPQKGSVFVFASPCPALVITNVAIKLYPRTLNEFFFLSTMCNSTESDNCGTQDIFIGDRIWDNKLHKGWQIPEFTLKCILDWTYFNILPHEAWCSIKTNKLLHVCDPYQSGIHKLSQVSSQQLQRCPQSQAATLHG